MNNSTLYTIGTALSRAKDHGIAVKILVGGVWVSGEVNALDEFGVILADDNAEHSVVRIESIDAVRIATRAPGQTSLPPAARPMPSPRSPAW